MRTANKPKTKFPKPGQIFLYIAMVAAMGFLNWTSTYEGKKVLNGVSGIESGLNQEQASGISREEITGFPRDFQSYPYL